MGHKTIRHTIRRNGIYYVRFRLPDNKFFRRSLEADSHIQAQQLMSLASPVIPFVQRGTIHPDQFGDRLSKFGNRLKQQNERWLTQQFFNDERRDSEIQSVVVHEYREAVTPAKVSQPQKQAEPKEVLTLAGTWNMYKKEKAQNWTKAISQANERFMEVLLIVLGTTTDVTMITKQDIKQVMEVVENLPKCVVQRCCLHIPEPGWERLPNWRSLRSNMTRTASGTIS
ncbi:Uncharacterised protein [Serratia plymuthica]|nr:Uncharacterised protein [Serratia plymuthica]